MDLRRLTLVLGALAVGMMSVLMMTTLATKFALVVELLFVAAATASLRRIVTSQNFLWYIFSAGAFVVTCLLTGLAYHTVYTDLLWVIVGTAVAASVIAITDQLEEWNRFWTYLTRTLWFVGSVAAGVGLVKLYLSTTGVYLSLFFDSEGVYVQGTATTPEYNSYAYGLALALASAYWLKRKDPSWSIANLAEASAPFLGTALLLTGSRRAVIFLIAGAAGVVWNRLGHWFRRKRADRQVRRYNWLTLIAYAVLIAVLLSKPHLVTEPVLDFLATGEVDSVLDRASTTFEEQGAQTRLPYYQFAADLYSGYSLDAKLFGGSFDYLTAFAGIIGAVEEDYPHNFILSSLLYGGIIQTAGLLMCLGQAIRSAYRVRNEFGPLFYILIVSVLFALVSSNSYFSMPMNTFILLFAAHPVLRQVWLDSRVSTRARVASKGPVRPRLPLPGMRPEYNPATVP